jgi:hypothetical protein
MAKGLNRTDLLTAYWEHILIVQSINQLPSIHRLLLGALEDMPPDQQLEDLSFHLQPSTEARMFFIEWPVILKSQYVPYQVKRLYLDSLPDLLRDFGAIRFVEKLLETCSSLHFHPARSGFTSRCHGYQT